MEKIVFDNSIYVIIPNRTLSEQLKNMVEAVTSDISSVIIECYNSELNLKNKRLLFVVELDGLGYDIEMIKFFSMLYKQGSDSLINSVGALLVHSSTELNTKRAAQDLVFHANSLGCTFIGHPLVEATSSLHNFLTWQKTLNLSLNEICLEMCRRLGNRLLSFQMPELHNSNITVLYSTPHKTSNTLDLWNMTSKHLKGYKLFELHIENGKVQDCKGCTYKLCMHYGKQNSCFYGGTMIEDVLPAIEKSDVIVWLCPNYNDSIAANLTAVINRLTVLYHQISFHEKCIYSIVVSGNSGSDSVAKQLLGALNINKGFILPPYFCLTATANDPGAIHNMENIELQAEIFAQDIIKFLEGRPF